MAVNEQFTPEETKEIRRLVRNERQEIFIDNRSQISSGLIYPSYVTSLPITPHHGQEIYYAADATNSRIWHFRYNANLASSYKLEYVGGSPLRATETETAVGTTSVNYIDLFSSALTLTAPLAGDYEMEWSAQGQISTAAAVAFMSLKYGSATTVDANGIRGQAPAANYDITWRLGSQDVSIAAAGTVVKAQFKVNTGTLTVNNAGDTNPFITMRPIRVG